MKSSELALLDICLKNKKLLTIPQYLFVSSLNKKRKLILTSAQYSFLKSTYDKIISKTYGLEKM